MAHVKRERDVMLECNNPFVVNLVASFQDAENVFMLMEAVMGGELFYYLQARAVRTGDRVQAVSGRLFARQQEIRAAFPRTPRAPPRRAKPHPPSRRGVRAGVPRPAAGGVRPLLRRLRRGGARVPALEALHLPRPEAREPAAHVHGVHQGARSGGLPAERRTPSARWRAGRLVRWTDWPRAGGWTVRRWRTFRS